MPQGYTPPSTTLNWAGLASDAAKQIQGIENRRTEEKDALDKAASELSNVVKSTPMGESQTMNSLIIGGADTGKSQINKWNQQLKNGEISPKDYKTKLANLNESWSLFANTAKSYDDRYKLAMARQEPDENGFIPAGAFELELASMFGQTAELNGKSLNVSDDGTVNMSSIDPATGELKDLIDIRDINRPENVTSNRLDVPSSIKSYTDKWDPYVIWEDLGRGSELTIENIRRNPQYETMSATVAEAVASDNNPRAQISVLVDNGVMNASYYRTPEEKQQKLNEELDRLRAIKKTAGQSTELSADEKKAAEFSLVQIAKDANGVINPVLTEEQKKAAKDRVMQEIEMQLGSKITASPKQDWYHAPQKESSAGSGKDAERLNEYQRGYIASLNAFGMTPEGGRTTPNLAGLSNQYQYVARKGAVDVYKMGSIDTKGEPTKGAVPVATARAPKDLAPYTVYGKSPAESATNYERGRAQYRTAKGMGGSAPVSESDPLGLGI